MATKKNDTATAPTPQSEAYEAAIGKYASGIDLLGKKEFAAARELFLEVETIASQEPELIQRSRSFATVCDRRLAPPAPDPVTIDEMYERGVFLSNAGNWDDALRLLDMGLVQDPTSVRFLYARACAWALKGSTERAVNDLRQAIAADPKIRFQAVNDPDFEKVREEPAFIDIIEPTPTGA